MSFVFACRQQRGRKRNSRSIQVAGDSRFGPHSFEDDQREKSLEKPEVESGPDELEDWMVVPPNSSDGRRRR